MAVGPCSLQLQERRPELVEMWSRCISEVLDLLHEEQVITTEDVSFVRGDHLGKTDQMRNLLDVLHGRGEESCRAFVDMLERKRHLLLQARSQPQQQHSQGSSLETPQNLLEVHKKILGSQHGTVVDYIGKSRPGQPLEESYTEITLSLNETFTVRGQHEVTEVGNAFKKLDSERRCEFETISKNLLQQDMVTAVLCGVAGSGKTTVTKRFVQYWSKDSLTSKIVFIFTFRELNLITECRSLQELLSTHYSHLKPILNQVFSKDPSRILFIFDGLDEFQFPLDFDKTPKCTDPEMPQRINHMVVNLLKGNLLHGCSMLITSRPHAVSKLPQALIQNFYKILGFSALQQKEYFRKSCGTPEAADEIWQYVSARPPLFLMCHIPAFCWIIVTALQEKISVTAGTENTITVTEIYCRFLKAILVFHGEQKDGSQIQKLLKAQQLLRTMRPRLKDLGALAFKGLVERRFIFGPGDLTWFALDQNDLSKMFLVEILKEDRDFLAYEKSYHFVHTSLQEFFAALYYVLESQTGMDPFSCLKSALLPVHRRLAAGMRKLFGPERVLRKRVKEAFNWSHRHQSGHMDLFCRFVSGLLVPRTRQILEGIFAPPGGAHPQLFLLRLLHKQLDSSSLVPERQVNVCHCLYEAQDPGMMDRLKSWLAHVSQGQAQNSPRDWTELAFLLQLANNLDELNLENRGLGADGLRRLLPVLPFFSTLRLGQNPLGSEGAAVLATVLKSPDCRIERLWVVGAGLGSEGVKMLSEGLKENSTVVDLRLAINNIGDDGAGCLADVLMRNRTLKDIRLRDNLITDKGAELFMAALRENTTLEYLWLFDNKISKAGVRRLKDFAKTRESLDIKSCT
ncbi:protein NLRC3 [Lepisosteus oculatus]|uniref:protein NLRC3 n=1 Tax=Lepisosteus oculatus TaxID=7918 RepID=UPI003721DE3D